MVERLLQHKFQLVVWGRSEAKIAPWREKDVKIANSPQELATLCDVVVTCVTDTAAMETVVFGNAGIAHSANGATVLIDHSTIHPVATRDYAERLHKANGMRWLDIPVSGGPIGAENGALIGMAGGPEDSLDIVMPILSAYAKQISLMGEGGLAKQLR